MEEKNKKNITSRTAIKGLINGFVAYSILIFFIIFILNIIISWQFENNINLKNNQILIYTIPTIGSIIIFFLIRGICKLSTFDLFKNCQIKDENINSVSSKMNLFFIGCIIFSVLIIIISLISRFNNEKINIQHFSNIYYSNFNENFAEQLTNELIDEFKENQAKTLIQTIIVETGLLLGIFSLIPTQKKLIKKYN